MILRNKKTGEIKAFDEVMREAYKFHNYNSIAELNEEWEDYEEPKDFYYIQPDGDIHIVQCKVPEYQLRKFKQIGNYFETKEEVEKAVEKLKAWKRLKNGGITFKNWTINQTGTIDCFATWGDNIPPSRKDPTLQEDLDLLFGGEE